MRMWVRSLALLSGLGSGIAMSCGVGCRHGSDPELLGLCKSLKLQLQFAPSLRTSICCRYSPKKTKDKKKKKKKKEYTHTHAHTYIYSPPKHAFSSKKKKNYLPLRFININQATKIILSRDSQSSSSLNTMTLNVFIYGILCLKPNLRCQVSSARKRVRDIH